MKGTYFTRRKYSWGRDAGGKNWITVSPLALCILKIKERQVKKAEMNGVPHGRTFRSRNPLKTQLNPVYGSVARSECRKRRRGITFSVTQLRRCARNVSRPAECLFIILVLFRLIRTTAFDIYKVVRRGTVNCSTRNSFPDNTPGYDVQVAWVLLGGCAGYMVY